MKGVGEIIGAIGVLVVFFAIVGWLGWKLIRKAQDPGWIIVKLILTFIIGIAGFVFALTTQQYAPLMILPFAVPLGLWWAPQIGAMLASPLTGMFDGGDQEVEAKPLYSIARTQTQKGEYQKAADEIRKQLEKFPNDYEGMMMLAELQAEKLSDLPSAEVTLGKIVENEKESPGHVSNSLNRLADWYLTLNLDPAAAKAALERIGQKYPGTNFAQMAMERIAHLPTSEYLMASKDPKEAIKKAGGRKISALREQVAASLKEPGEEEANALVQKLQEFPDDAQAREELAMIYASHYQRPDLAQEQLRLLIENPAQSHKQIVRWLNELADIQIKSEKADIARATLREIGKRFPGTAAAEQAEARIILVEREVHAKKTPQAMKLGSYKKDLGLTQN